MNQIKVELQDWMGSDRAIAEAAWTSSTEFQKKEMKSEEDVKRIVNMLADSKHSVPFESVVLRFHIRMPIAIDRQYMTHRLQSASGMSGRYRTMPDEFLKVPQDVLDIVEKASGKSLMYEYTYNNICEQANQLYRQNLMEMRDAERKGLITNAEYKRVREFSRGVCPQHNMTERVSIINLRSFCNMVKLRSKKGGAQPEVVYVVDQMLNGVKENNVCPIAMEAVERNGWSI